MSKEKKNPNKTEYFKKIKKMNLDLKKFCIAHNVTAIAIEFGDTGFACLWEEYYNLLHLKNYIDSKMRVENINYDADMTQKTKPEKKDAKEQNYFG